MNKKHIAIVGSGIGGLTAALLLTKQGYQVTVYEKSHRVGGRLAYEEEGPYRIDQGPTIVLLPDMLLDILEEAGVDRSRVELIRCDPMHRFYFEDGRVLSKWSNREEQVAEINRVFPGEGQGFQRFMSEMDPLFPKGVGSILERPFSNQRDFYSRDMTRLLKQMRAYTSLRSAMSRYFRSEQLRDAYSLQSLYIGGSPLSTPGIYTLLPYAEHEYGVWMVKGGYAALAPMLAEELKNRGAIFHLNEEVKSLVVEDGSCKGVVTSRGTASYDAVIYNGDFPQITGLLTTKQRRKKRTFKASSGCLLVYLGVEKRFEEATTHQFFLPDAFVSNMKDVFQKRTLPDHPSFYVFNPVSTDESAAPEGHSVLYFLIPVPNAETFTHGEETEKLVEKVLEEAENKAFPGLRKHIRWQKVRTPHDAKRDGLYGGGSFGIAPVLFQSGVYRPQPKPYPNIQGLYAAGASIHPGGGVPIVMQGAKLAANQLIKELGS
ncbi:phytoene desaturase family protein [Paenibacillus sp. Marseille-Q4541]|uniref:phytoene desaturase family protein n=1 Tax=Paenibacillus sp. Marseille-Q4541 TaxID=2831522 RepID=UPI001BAB049D|nr:phytoene desaturase family protein [Paenibacillus sp. Marseille-Q4541]